MLNVNTDGSPSKMNAVPFPWCTSTSTTAAPGLIHAPRTSPAIPWTALGAGVAHAQGNPGQQPRANPAATQQPGGATCRRSGGNPAWWCSSRAENAEFVSRRSSRSR